ncbi:hypothetical protein HF929_09055 [Acidithiobacillus ferrivorans]|nr:hypothetical protein [Acidithiobacillus ferrivorans]
MPVPPRKAAYFRASAELRAQVDHG